MIYAIDLIFFKSKKRFQKKATFKEFRYFAEKNNNSQFKTKLSQGNSSFVKKFEFKLPEI